MKVVTKEEAIDILELTSPGWEFVNHEEVSSSYQWGGWFCYVILKNTLEGKVYKLEYKNCLDSCEGDYFECLTEDTVQLIPMEWGFNNYTDKEGWVDVRKQ